ncbi:MAG: DUF808 domain-containing protein [Bowdeniella nasicola]|nr:DUF808 domain-containing protein [Bowdeniella nasicola]
MAAGLAALLDDMATLARMAMANLDDVAAAAGKASAKAAGVVIDDTAVTPQYLHGLRPERELPIIKRITLGSLRNKLLIILPLALVLSQFAPWLITPLLMVGGCYLCFEGMEKVWEKLTHHTDHAAHQPKLARGKAGEDQVVRSAVFTDLILSTEIMVIALSEVSEEAFAARTIILVIVALAITFLVYGVVAIIVKMDDIGLHFAARDQRATAAFGRFLVAAMPRVLTGIGVVGTLAMVWVGGHIFVVGLADLGWALPVETIGHLEALTTGWVAAGFFTWLVNTAASLLIGAVWGLLLVWGWQLLPLSDSDDGAAPVVSQVERT